jgi:VanZ family protein
LLTRVLRWLPPLLWMALIYRESSLPDPAPALTAVVWDKALHFGGYALLGLLFARALYGDRPEAGRAAFVAILLTSLYGASDEWHQRYTPMRESDASDWLADSAGGALGAGVYTALLAAASGPARRTKNVNTP